MMMVILVSLILRVFVVICFFFFFQAEDGIRDKLVTGVQTCALPIFSTDNLLTPNARDAASAYWMRRTAEQDLEHADMADARTLNEAIWFSVRGARSTMPESASLPASDAMRVGINTEAEREEDEGRVRSVPPAVAGGSAALSQSHARYSRRH